MRLYQAASMGAPGVARSKSLQVNMGLGAGAIRAHMVLRRTYIAWFSELTKPGDQQGLRLSPVFVFAFGASNPHFSPVLKLVG